MRGPTQRERLELKTRVAHKLIAERDALKAERDVLKEQRDELLAAIGTLLDGLNNTAAVTCVRHADARRLYDLYEEHKMAEAIAKEEAIAKQQTDIAQSKPTKP